MTSTPHVLLISGSLRTGSTNSALLRTAHAVAPDGITTTLYDGLDGLPHFSPDRDRPPLPVAVAALRAAIHDADAVLFSTPEYAGGLPGAFKNLLDWTVGDDQPGSIYGKPVAWLNASAARTGATDAHDSLRIVLGYAHATVVAGACRSVPVTRQAVGDDGLVHDPGVRTALAEALVTLVAHTVRQPDRPPPAPGPR